MGDSPFSVVEDDHLGGPLLLTVPDLDLYGNLSYLPYLLRKFKPLTFGIMNSRTPLAYMRRCVKSSIQAPQSIGSKIPSARTSIYGYTWRDQQSSNPKILRFFIIAHLRDHLLSFPFS